MVRAMTVYLDFCYIARRASHTTSDLAQLDEALIRFHKYRTIFQETGVREAGPGGVSLPRQHSLMHYRELIEQFGLPNGLCTSITEAKHIKAVKEPWRRSSRFEALGQMLLTNQRIDKLAASRTDFAKRGMLDGNCLYEIWGQHFPDETDAREILNHEPGATQNDDIDVEMPNHAEQQPTQDDNRPNHSDTNPNDNVNMECDRPGPQDINDDNAPNEVFLTGRYRM